jgi:hypothetical protein
MQQGSGHQHQSHLPLGMKIMNELWSHPHKTRLQARLLFPAGILRNHVISIFVKLFDRNRDSTPAGKCQGAWSEIQSVWTSVESHV